MKSYDEAKIAKMPGVKKVVKVKDSAVAVVAETWWQAKTALDALPIVWDEGPNASVSSASIAQFLKEGLTAAETNGEIKRGDALAAIAGAAKKVEATYATPFLSHACMEMMNATVKLSADKAECWVPTQNLEASLAALSEESGVPSQQVRGLSLRSRRRLRPARRHPGLHPPGRRHRQGIPRHSGQAGLEPRGRPGARLLPADLAMQDVRGPRCRRQPDRPAHAFVGPVDQRDLEPGRHRRTAGTAASSRAGTRSRMTRSSATPCRTCCSNT